MGLKHNVALLIRDEVLLYHLEYYLGKRSGGVDYPLYLDHIREEPEVKEEDSKPLTKSPKRKDKEEKKDERSPVKKPELLKPQEVEREKSKRLLKISAVNWFCIEGCGMQ